MNAHQKTAIGVGVVVFVAMGLFPPWTYIGIVPPLKYIPTVPTPVTVRIPAGYAFIGSGVGERPTWLRRGGIRRSGQYDLRDIDFWSSQIDIPRLVIQWAAVLVLTGAVFAILTDKRHMIAALVPRAGLGTARESPASYWLCPKCGRHAPVRMNACQCGFDRTTATTPVTEVTSMGDTPTMQHGNEGQSNQVGPSARPASQLLTTRGVLVSFAAVLVLSIAYYFVIALPAHNRAVLDLREELRAAQEAKEAAEWQQAQEALVKKEAQAREKALQLCIDVANDDHDAFIRLNGTEVWEGAGKVRSEALDECYRRWDPR